MLSSLNQVGPETFRTGRYDESTESKVKATAAVGVSDGTRRLAFACFTTACRLGNLRTMHLCQLHEFIVKYKFPPIFGRPIDIVLAGKRHSGACVDYYARVCMWSYECDDECMFGWS